MSSASKTPDNDDRDPAEDLRRLEALRSSIISFEEHRSAMRDFLKEQWSRLESLEFAAPAWIRQYRRNLKNLENLYVNVLDHDADAGSAGSLNEVKHALDEMLALLREARAGILA